MQGHWFILTKQIKETVLGLMLFPESQHQATIQNQYGQEKGKENGGGESNVQNFKDKYNIYN